MVHRARRYHRVFKIAALERMAAGESVSALSRQLGIRPKLLYRWRDAVQRGAIEALRGVGGPRSGERLVERPPLVPPPGVVVPAALALALARARSAALERRIGRQALKPCSSRSRRVERRARRPTLRCLPPHGGWGADNALVTRRYRASCVQVAVAVKPHRVGE